MADSAQDDNLLANHHPEYFLRDGNITFIVCYNILIVPGAL